MVRDISDYLEKFFQQKIYQGKFIAYDAFINKKTIKETEDETIITIKKGLTLVPSVNWNNRSPLFLKYAATNDLYHVHLKNQEQHRVCCRTGFNSVCIFEKIKASFNLKSINNHFADVGLPLDIIAGRIEIKYWEANFEGDCTYKEPSLFDIRREKEQDHLLQKFCRFALSSPYPLRTLLERAPAALSIVEDYKEGTLSFPEKT